MERDVYAETPPSPHPARRMYGDVGKVKKKGTKKVASCVCALERKVGCRLRRPGCRLSQAPLRLLGERALPQPASDCIHVSIGARSQFCAKPPPFPTCAVRSRRAGCFFEPPASSKIWLPWMGCALKLLKESCRLINVSRSKQRHSDQWYAQGNCNVIARVVQIDR